MSPGLTSQTIKAKFKIVFIYPTYYQIDEYLFKTNRAFLPPLSIYHLAGLTPDSYDISVIDEAVEEIDFNVPVHLAGISVTTNNAKRAYEIADAYRKRGVTVIIGGIHPTSLPNEAKDHADAVVLGEAEKVWGTVLDDFEKNQLKGFYTGSPCDPFENLPHPRFNLIKRSHYFKPPFCKDTLVPIQTSRGCPHSCDFCSVTRFWGKKLRFRPIHEVVEEIKMCNTRLIFFTDDNFFANPSRLKELCEALIPLKIKFICQIDTRIGSHEDLIILLKKAGCFMVFIGLERIDISGLNSLNKSFNGKTSYPQLFNNLHHNKIAVYASLIFGLQGDTPDIVYSTTDFLSKYNVEIAAFFAITPFPGTSLFERSLSKGYLTDKEYWMHRVKPGNLGLLKYPENAINEYELCLIARHAFFSLGSIFARFKNFRRFKILPLLFNLQQYKYLKTSQTTVV
jgi:radical SAM superfamily enzyme YgiQ (UPF0313 family)